MTTMNRKQVRDCVCNSYREMKAAIQRSPRKESKILVTVTSKERQRGPHGLAQNKDMSYIG